MSPSLRTSTRLLTLYSSHSISANAVVSKSPTHVKSYITRCTSRADEQAALGDRRDAIWSMRRQLLEDTGDRPGDAVRPQPFVGAPGEVAAAASFAALVRPVQLREDPPPPPQPAAPPPNDNNPPSDDPPPAATHNAPPKRKRAQKTCRITPAGIAAGRLGCQRALVRARKGSSWVCPSCQPNE